MSQPPLAPEPQRTPPGSSPYPGPQQPPGPYGGPQPPSGPYAGAPVGGPGQGGPPAPAKKSNVGKIVLLIVVAALVVGTVASLALRHALKGVTDSSTIRVVAPETLDNRAKATDHDLQASAQKAETGVKSAVPNATSVATGFYGTAEKKDLALIVAYSSVNLSPQKTLDDTITGISSSSMTPTGMHTVDAGPLGGVAKCGDAESSGVKLGICVWADGGSAGQFYSYFASADAAQKELASVRQAVEQKS